MLLKYFEAFFEKFSFSKSVRKIAVLIISGRGQKLNTKFDKNTEFLLPLDTSDSLKSEISSYQ